MAEVKILGKTYTIREFIMGEMDETVEAIQELEANGVSILNAGQISPLILSILFSHSKYLALLVKGTLVLPEQFAEFLALQTWVKGWMKIPDISQPVTETLVKHMIRFFLSLSTRCEVSQEQIDRLCEGLQNDSSMLATLLGFTETSPDSFTSTMGTGPAFNE